MSDADTLVAGSVTRWATLNGFRALDSVFCVGTVVATEVMDGGGTMNNQSMTSSFWLAMAAMSTSVLFGCATTSGTRPEDMSAEAHKEKAQVHDEKAEVHESKYDPNAPGAAYTEVVQGSDFAFEGGAADLNPTDVHNIQAQKHRRHADEHLAAATALERAEEDACASVPADSRSWCPLLGPVSATENTAHGVRITVKEGTNVEVMVARIRCHIAVADTEGREGMDSCPLYVRGLEVEQSAPNTIELKVKGKANVHELQKRVADHVGE